MNLINPLEEFGNELCSVQNPAAYIGGEFGETVKPHSNDDKKLNFAIAFPDVYTIAMANQAIKIIYNGLNQFADIRCERVFAVEKDFEQLLKKHDVPLYTLETGIPLNKVDILGFSVGYELGVTGALSILDLGKIPLLKKDRTEDDPIVIAGGCGSTNPEAFSDFFDAFFIGEAEGGMFDLIEELAQMKKSGAKRSEILARFAQNPHVWTENMSLETTGHKIATRAVWADFGKVPSVESFLPLPNIKPVQDHGVVEIMRGCPNGCRFCHAGIYYRPQRAKSKQLIFDEVDRLVNEGGYREISLTSLSSADYPDIENLLDELTERYKPFNVSFQLPSLKVNSFSLPLLNKLSEVRKSGLTFAVETPDEMWQIMLNKEVYAQHLVDIILDAKKLGWKSAKFYFMVGLPLPETENHTEEKAIVDFMLDLQAKTNIQCNVNVGTFIPKPHTPYQWARQISPEESDRKLKYIKDNLPRGKFKVGAHDINTSFVEGLFSRGDKRAGKVILSAYKKGARLDAWENHLRENMPFWEEAFIEADYDVKSSILRERDKNEALPWDSVSLGPSKSFYKKEWEKHEKVVLTQKCKMNCDHRCGVCNNKIAASTDTKPQNLNLPDLPPQIHRPEWNIPVMFRTVFAFTKKNGGEYISHLSMIESFNRAFLKCSLPVVYSVGFNPIPRLEFASNLSLGIASDCEIASCLFYENLDENDFIKKINAHLPQTIQIYKAFIFPVSNQRRRESLATGLWGNIFEYDFKVPENEIKSYFESDDAKTFLDEKNLCGFNLDGTKLTAKLLFKFDRPFRNSIEEYFGKKIWEIAKIHKIQTLAKPEITGWTPEMNEDYQKSLEKMSDRNEIARVNKKFKGKVLHSEENVAGEETLTYFELYKKIALVNEKLIHQREETIAGKR